MLQVSDSRPLCDLYSQLPKQVRFPRCLDLATYRTDGLSFPSSLEWLLQPLYPQPHCSAPAHILEHTYHHHHHHRQYGYTHTVVLEVSSPDNVALALTGPPHISPSPSLHPDSYHTSYHNESILLLNISIFSRYPSGGQAEGRNMMYVGIRCRMRTDEE